MYDKDAVITLIKTFEANPTHETMTPIIESLLEIEPDAEAMTNTEIKEDVYEYINETDEAQHPFGIVRILCSHTCPDYDLMENPSFEAFFDKFGQHIING